LIRIAHISDLHITKSKEFLEKIFERGVKAVNSLEPKADLIFISGDITWEGVLSEYELAAEKIKEFEGSTMVIPGNHDSRHLGYQLFQEYFGRLEFYKELGDLGVLGLDSTEPDLDEGHIGRDKYKWIEDNLKIDKKFQVIGFHHHLVPVPNSGREQNILNDAGGVLDVVLRNNTALVLMGHRHVPYSVRVHRTLMVNAGTFSSARTRAHLGHGFNIIDLEGTQITVTSYDLNKEKEKLIVEFDRDNRIYVNRYYSK
jgi:3',5'-cyclic AMP phosphodiesterase CpdA